MHVVWITIVEQFPFLLLDHTIFHFLCFSIFCIPFRIVSLISNGATSKGRQEHDRLQVEMHLVSHTLSRNGWRVSLTPMMWGFPIRIPANRSSTASACHIRHCCQLFSIAQSRGLHRLSFSFEVLSVVTKNNEYDRILTWVKRVGKFQSMEFVTMWGHPCCFHVLLRSPCPH